MSTPRIAGPDLATRAVPVLLNTLQALADMASAAGKPEDTGLSSLIAGLRSAQSAAARQAQPPEVDEAPAPSPTQGAQPAQTAQLPQPTQQPPQQAQPQPQSQPQQGVMQSLSPLVQLTQPMLPGGKDNGSFRAKDPAIEQWAPDIEKAAKASGLDPNLIGAQMWRESHGRQSTNTQNIDGTRDIGLMQIGQERWSNVLAPALDPADRAAIQQATGKRPENLDVTNPHDNVIAGAFHLKINIDKLGGNVPEALKMYVGPNDPAYADSILNKNMPALEAGRNMPDPA